MNKLIVLGAGGHGRVVADVAKRACFYSEVAFLDDVKPADGLGYPYLGKWDDVDKYIDTYDMCVAIGDNESRRRIANLLKECGARLATVVAADAVVGSDVFLGEGSVVLSGVVINSGSRIGEGVIVNTASVIDHDCIIGDFCHVSVGAKLCGAVHIGENVCIGAGVTVRDHTEICKDCNVLVGSVVSCDLLEPGMYNGMPARILE